VRQQSCRFESGGFAAALHMKILFVCQHGGAKSVLAACYFNRMAAERGLPYVAESVAAEDPYDAVPPPVAESLLREGIDVRAFRPRRATAEEIAGAAKVIAIDCRVEGERWDDVPMASVDLEGAAAAIRRHVLALIAQLP
jgi:arsenate reductase